MGIQTINDMDIQATKAQIKEIGDDLARLSNEAEHGFARISRLAMELANAAETALSELDGVREKQGRETGLTFSQALERMKRGTRVRRRGWATKGAWIKIHDYPNSQISPCIAWYAPLAYIQPGWTCSQADMLAEDWELCGEEETANTWHVFAITELPVRNKSIYPVIAASDSSLGAMFLALEIKHETGAPIVAALTPSGTLEVIGLRTHDLHALITGELITGPTGACVLVSIGAR